jgi:uncharacterized protein DUF6448
MRKRVRAFWSLLPALALVALPGPEARAHCDTLDGPVVTAAKKALETGDPNPVLIWVKQQDEGAIKDAFQKAQAVRKLSPEAKDLADMYFFETVVRVHRAGEGAPYTGLKSAGLDLGPAIPAADKALADGSTEALQKLLQEAVRTGLKERFEKVSLLRGFPPEDVRAGREFVEAYVTYIHYVERLYEAATAPSAGHYGEGAHAEVEQ